MSYSTAILCLANSRKYSGHCIAGKTVRNGIIGSWVRPVSIRRTGELNDDECFYQDRTTPEVLDVMAVPLKKASPHNYQTENYIVDENSKWKFLGKARWSDAVSAVDYVDGELWMNGSDSSSGKNDRVAEPIAKQLQRSLYLVRPYGLSVQVATEGNDRKVRANFSINTIPYNFVVTDPIMTELYSKQRDGAYPIKDALLCVSLGELFYGYAYKLVAAVITPDMGA